MGWSPDSGRAARARRWRDASAACVLLAALGGGPAQAQTIDALRPVRDGFLAPQDSPLRRTVVSGLSDAAPTVGVDTPISASSPPRQTGGPLPGRPAASGAADTGYDSLNRTRKKPRYYPAQPRPKPPPGPGTRPSGELTGQLRPTLPPSASANKPPIPAAMAGTVPGQPPRKRLKIDDDPFGAVGDYAGPFLVKGAVELSAGYDSNPARLGNPRGMPAWMIAPEFLAVSNWERHALVADLRGSFTGYGSTLPARLDGGVNPAPTTLDRPDFTGHLDGRLDVSRDTSVGAQLRLRAATDNPGSPNVQAGLARYPVATTLGTTIGIDQRFNRLQISAGATADRTSYQQSKLTDGSATSNDDRNFNQYGGIGRVSYEVMPGLKPFAEIQGDSRVHDQRFDRAGYQRDSAGGTAKAGSSFEFTRLLTGELSIGYATRSYVDPRLNRLQGFLTSASLVWSATPLTTARFLSDTQLAETTVAGASGVLVRTYTVQVDHDFRRWLTGIGKFSFGTLDYQGYGRSDRTYSAEGNLVYKMTRSLWVKGSLRYDKLDSNITGAGSSGTVVMLGVRLQN
ncbi:MULTISPECIES: outer membrane beta-barrel protein [Bradyrhizobium]|uniref:Outer membrane beta-barrel protein n=3 Tax=Bradyrhizobium TaxID=374 RepID=A0ABS5GID1_9BRAD|nr:MULTISPECIES: outer membrane beta-barrel protein [Bradyrhizobium]MBR1140905.1 outer membrane beta-barrel protein [Bradyrhizobium denitrificans]MDU0956178.1 outer membrane beta-barrel protein [Bradyrhizobium sp.]MDU1493815.1 outer membrane beta-barrel protein [Bradyrhizobium sp.]MDU1545522.1 outer membrane beta-barrel protein [Bradyrhizobium sp.]MDU1669977.1 outer membrane beta-barrel protein [Bradyrhizobium sp.]